MNKIMIWEILALLIHLSDPFGLIWPVPCVPFLIEFWSLKQGEFEKKRFRN